MKERKEPLLVYNTTRYFTEDIVRIVDATVGRLTWRPHQITVSYYSVSKKAKEDYRATRDTGLFVKMLRNGDEDSASKVLKLVKPTRFDGISELEQLAVTSDNQAPAEVVRQLMRRVSLMRRWQWAEKGPGWWAGQISKEDAAKMDVAIKARGLKLRFNNRDPSPALKAWRKKLVCEERNSQNKRAKLEQTNAIIQQTERALMANRERLTQLNQDKNQCEVQVSAAEMAVATLLLKSGGETVR
jgi:hypothetical protein